VLNLGCIPIPKRGYVANPWVFALSQFYAGFAPLALQAFLTTWHRRLLWQIATALS